MVPGISPTSPVTSDIVCEARVTTSLAAQLDYELELIAGSVIQILQVLDDGFAVGRCGDKVGQFPMSFVEPLQVQQHSEKAQVTPHQNQRNSESPTKHANVAHASTGHSGYTAGKKSHSRKGSYTHLNTRSHDSFVTPYAKTLYQFVAVSADELSFQRNEIVTLISHIDDEWMEGELDGRRGIFPTNYVDIIVDCPSNDDSNSKPKSSSGDSSRNGQPAVTESAVEQLPETYGRAMYNFTGEGTNDLNLQEGDTVTILRQVNADWFEAQHDDGRIGFCPVTYIEVFGSEPICPDALPSPSTPVAIGQPNGSESSTVNGTGLSSMQHKPSVKPKPPVKPKVKSPSSSLPLSESLKQEDSTSTKKTAIANISRMSSENKRIPPAVVARKSPAFALQNFDSHSTLDDLIKNELSAVFKDKSPKTAGADDASIMRCRSAATFSNVASSCQDVKPSHARSFELRHANSDVGARPTRPGTGHDISSIQHIESLTYLNMMQYGTEENLRLTASKSTRPDNLPVSAHQPTVLPVKKKAPPPPPPSRCGLRSSGDAKRTLTVNGDIPRIKPRRPAPPCPAQSRSTMPRSGRNLMEFSPEQGKL